MLTSPMDKRAAELLSPPSHFKYTLPSANTGIYLDGSASDLWIKPHQFKNMCEDIDRGQLAYAGICDKSDCFGSTLLFFFVKPIHRWSTHWIQFFFNFERILYWYEIKAYFLKNLLTLYNHSPRIHHFWAKQSLPGLLVLYKIVSTFI